jgi:colanic acid biosynthesis glycosyl transferase WcaI
MKVWIISELYYPDEAATGHYMTGIAEGLATKGPVHVICAQPHYFAPVGRAPSREVHNGVHIERCRATTLDKNRFLFKLVNVFSTSLSILLMALSRIGRGDVVLVVTNPPLLPFVVALVCHLRGARCVLRIDDVYPEAMVKAGLIQPDGLVAWVLNGLTRRLYHNVERIVVLGRDMQRRVAPKMERRQDRITVITNWADLESVTPTPRAQNALLRELGLTMPATLARSRELTVCSRLRSSWPGPGTFTFCLLARADRPPG